MKPAPQAALGKVGTLDVRLDSLPPQGAAGVYGLLTPCCARGESCSNCLHTSASYHFVLWNLRGLATLRERRDTSQTLGWHSAELRPWMCVPTPFLLREKAGTGGSFFITWLCTRSGVSGVRVFVSHTRFDVAGFCTCQGCRKLSAGFWTSHKGY